MRLNPSTISAAEDERNLTFNTEESDNISSASPNAKKFKDIKLDKKESDETSNLSDKAAALNAVSFSIGSVIGPPLGGGLYEAWQWENTLQFMALVSFVSAAIYILINFLSRCMRSSKK